MYWDINCKADLPFYVPELFPLAYHIVFTVFVIPQQFRNSGKELLSLSYKLWWTVTHRDMPMVTWEMSKQKKELSSLSSKLSKTFFPTTGVGHFLITVHIYPSKLLWIGEKLQSWGGIQLIGLSHFASQGCEPKWNHVCYDIMILGQIIFSCRNSSVGFPCIFCQYHLWLLLSKKQILPKNPWVSPGHSSKNSVWPPVAEQVCCYSLRINEMSPLNIQSLPILA